MDKKIIEENGVEYEVKKSLINGGRCKSCDASYYHNEYCRIREYDCRFNEILKIVNNDVMIVKGKVIKYNNNTYIAINGECMQCAFFDESKCTLQGFACKGDNIKLVKVDKGGI